MSKFTCFLLCFYVSSSWAIVPPEIAWKTLTTDHFEIIYEEKTRGMAEEIGRSAERAYALLTPVFKPPEERTVVWIYDHTDAPNGLATPIPQNLIILFPVLPGPLDSIGHYDKWSQMLITHEYTHILNMEPSLGFWGPLRTIFGTFMRPNALLPNWYLEGLAVEAETQFTKYGRLRSPTWSGLIRALVMEDRWWAEGLGVMNEVLIPTWPYGLRPYFWGGLLMHEIAQRQSFDKFGYLNERYAARVPFFLNAPIKDLLGINYQELLKDIRLTYDRKAKEQIARIAETDKADRNLTPTKHGDLLFDVLGPSMSPDNLKLAYIRNNEDHDSEVHVLTREKVDMDFDFSKSNRIYKGTDVSSLGWMPDSKTIIFDATDSGALYTAYSDLWKINIDDKKKEQITTGERAQEPQVDRDGHRIVFVRSSAGRTELGVVVRDNKVNYVYAPPELYRISRPSFLNEEEIIFSERNPEGQEFLKVFNLQTKDVRIVLREYAPARNVTVAKNGILFVSDRSGIQNLYWSSKSLISARPVTNSRTTISTGTYDPSKDRIIYAQMTGTGTYLYSQRMPVESFSLPKTEPLISEPRHQWSEPTLRTKTEHGEYSPIDYMFPKYWLPLFGLIPDGFIVTAITGAKDPLGKHAYAVAGTYDSLAGKVGGDARYDMQAGDGVASLQGGVDYRYYYAYGTTTENTYIDMNYGLFPTRKNKYWILGARLSQGSTDIPGFRRYEYAGPGAFVSYNDVSQKVTDISPSSGMAALIDYQYFVGSLGNVNFPRYRGNFTYYESRIFPKRHVAALQLDGYFSPRNRSVFLGTSSGGNYSLTYLTAKSYITRGYPVGEFLGWNMGVGSLEYRFPVFDRPSELGTFPTTFRRWHGAVFVDAVTLEGFYYSRERNGAQATEMGRFFYGTGVEARTDITLAYHLPAMFRFGIFWGLNHEAYGGIIPYVSMSVPEF